MELTPRQVLVLRRVVEAYERHGQPVGSKWLAEQKDLDWRPSTIRAELAQLEELNLLQHPHTSAGRIPTDRGYRTYVDDLLPTLPAPPPPAAVDDTRRELDDALRATTEQLSQVTNLLAIVSAPPIATTTIRHVEVLQLQPQVAMVVIITSTGGVNKRVVSYAEPLDPGLVHWAASYLNDQVRGMGLGARMLHGKLASRELSESERGFLATLAPAFTELEETAEDTLFVEGAGRLLSEDRLPDLSQINELMTVLERRVALLRVIRAALDEPRIFLRIGSENEEPELRSLSVVGASYGLASRSLGAVSVLGPMRMDYATAIVSVRQAAAGLSRFVSDLYAE